MPHFFNISQQLLSAFRATFETASHANFSVGYFNLWEYRMGLNGGEADADE